MRDLPEQLAGIDLVTPLTRTLRAGILDELGWDALDAAAAELKGETWCRASWPVLTVHNRGKAIAVGPGGRIDEHSLRVPREGSRFHHDPQVFFSDGQFLVCHYINGRQTHYWSNEPDTTFSVRPRMWESLHYERDQPGYTFLAPNGRRFMGPRLLRPLEERIGPNGHMFHDGHTYWWLQKDGLDSQPCRITDPHTGELDEDDAPDFFDPHLLDEDEHWRYESSSLAPLPHGVPGSPLGSDGTRVGLRVAEDRTTGTVRCHRIDGVEAEFDPATTPTAVWGLLDIPGALRPLVLSGDAQVIARDADTGALYWRAERMNTGWTRTDPDPAAAGTRLLPPPAFFHFLTPRDPAGSRALRTVSEDTVSLLLKAATTSDETLRTAVTALLPEITHPLLAQGVTGMIQKATEWLTVRDKIVTRLHRARNRD